MPIGGGEVYLPVELGHIADVLLDDRLQAAYGVSRFRVEGFVGGYPYVAMAVFVDESDIVGFQTAVLAAVFGGFYLAVLIFHFEASCSLSFIPEPAVARSGDVA